MLVALVSLLELLELSPLLVQLLLFFDHSHWILRAEMSHLLLYMSPLFQLYRVRLLRKPFLRMWSKTVDDLPIDGRLQYKALRLILGNVWLLAKKPAVFVIDNFVDDLLFEEMGLDIVEIADHGLVVDLVLQDLRFASFVAVALYAMSTLRRGLHLRC